MVTALGWKGWALLLLLDFMVPIVLSMVRKRRLLLAADVAAAVGGLLGLNTFVLLRAFIVDRSQCGTAPATACLLNTNRGVWTFGAMCVAAATLYISARMKQAEENRAESRRRAQASRAIGAALDEIVHNLQHFAHEIRDDQSFSSFPATTIDSTFALVGGDVAFYCAPGVVSRVRVLQRITAHNRAMVRAAAEVDRAMKLVGLMDDIGIATFSRSEWMARVRGAQPPEEVIEKTKIQAPGVATPVSPLDAVRCDLRVITHLVRCMMEIALFHPKEASDLLQRPEFRWLEVFRSRAGSYWYFPKSSEVSERDAAAIRADGVPLYCWINDRPIENVEIVAVRTACRDLVHAPH